MLTPSLNARLKFQHQTISELISGKTETQLRQRATPDKWSVLENIAHLALYQPVFLDRIEKILEGTQPTFDRYVADTDPAFPSFVQMPIGDLLASLNDIRARICHKVENLPPEKLSLIGHHPKFGSLTVPGWIEFFVLHEAHHLFTIFQLLPRV